MRKKLQLMGGEIEIIVEYKDSEICKSICDLILTQMKTLVDIFNFYDTHSLLSQLNTTQRCEYNPYLELLLQESFRFYTLSKGKFNSFKGKEIMQLKSEIMKNIKGEKVKCEKMKSEKMKSEKIKDEKVESNNNKSITTHFNSLFEISKTQIILKDKNMVIDLGGIAKGFIIDMCITKVTQKYTLKNLDIVINARGDIICFGNTKKNIGIENPFNEEIFETTTLEKGSIVTSGHNKQQFKSKSHIIGSKTDIYTLTLKSTQKKTYELDALATYLIQLPSYKVIEIIEFDEYFKDVKCLLVLNSGEVIRSLHW